MENQDLREKLHGLISDDDADFMKSSTMLEIENRELREKLNKLKDEITDKGL